MPRFVIHGDGEDPLPQEAEEDDNLSGSDDVAPLTDRGVVRNRRKTPYDVFAEYGSVGEEVDGLARERIHKPSSDHILNPANERRVLVDPETPRSAPAFICGRTARQKLEARIRRAKASAKRVQRLVLRVERGDVLERDAVLVREFMKGTCYMSL
jgi:hypothetical protein